MVVVSEERLGVRIRRLRVARGMTQIELAAAMRALGERAEGHTISRYESDVYEPKLRAFAVLARALGSNVVGEEFFIRLRLRTPLPPPRWTAG